MSNEDNSSTDIPAEWMKSDHERELTVSTELETMLSASPFSPQALLNFLEKDDFLRAQFAKSAGVHEGYSINQHTQMVLGQFEKYFAKPSLLSAGVTLGSLRLLLAFHDIGKPGYRSKDDQHHQTTRIIEQYYPTYQRSPSETALARGLIQGDLIGEFIKYSYSNEDVARTVAAIEFQANQARVPLGEFFELLLIYYQVDAGSYTEDSSYQVSVDGATEIKQGQRSLDFLFKFDSESGRMDFADRTKDQIEVLRQAVQKRIDQTIELQQPPIDGVHTTGRELAGSSAMSLALLETDPLKVNETNKPEHEQSAEARMIEAFLNSPELIEKIRSFPEKDRETIFGCVVEYLVITKTTDGVLEGIERLRNSGAIEAYNTGIEWKKDIAQEIGNQLGVDATTVEGKRQIFDRYAANRSYYHGFNGSLEPLIQLHGLSDSERVWDWQELKHIAEIGTKGGIPMLLGWGTLNSENALFVSGTPSVSFYYASNSPEWFAQFVGAGFHTDPTGDQKKAFVYRDYEMAKRNVLETCDRMGQRITLEERADVLVFFDKYWRKLAGENSRPKLAIIQEDAIQEPLSETFDEFGSATRSDPIKMDLGRAMWIATDSHVDIPIRKAIPMVKIMLVNLPSYEALFPRNIT